MRAIDADALREQLPEPDDWRDPERALVHITGIWAEIDNAPTIEPERKKGEWIHGREVCREYMGIIPITVQYDHWECSVCGYRAENEPIWKFCPNCGADMREDQDG